jgi:seryl-tRNA synthetase
MLDPARMDDVLRRGPEVGPVVAAWKSLDEARRKLQNELDTARQQRNAGSDRMAKLDKKSAEFASARDELKALSTKIKDGEAELARLEAESETALFVIPNAPHASVPTGTGEHDNVPHHTWGEKPSFAFAPKPHWEVGEALGILDYNAGTNITGARVTV